VTHLADERVLPFSVALAEGRVLLWMPGAPPWSDLRDAFEEDYFASPLAYGGRYEHANPPRKLASYLREVRRAAPGGRLLDVGCAFGRFLQVATPHYACEGLDVSRYALTVARRRVPQVPLHHGAIEDFTADERYDVVTCFDVLEHVPALGRALARLRGLLESDGRLVAVVPVYDTPAGRAVGLIDRDPTHVHRWSRQAWLERFRVAGFAPLVVKGVVRVPMPGFFVHGISRWWRAWAPAMLVVCAPRSEETA
jgi:SAM-dependent methyltransferase